jgi:hypothetical protein
VRNPLPILTPVPLWIQERGRKLYGTPHPLPPPSPPRLALSTPLVEFTLYRRRRGRDRVTKRTDKTPPRQIRYLSSIIRRLYLALVPTIYGTAQSQESLNGGPHLHACMLYDFASLLGAPRAFLLRGDSGQRRPK